ncbi:DEAD/DEAH box helicase [Mollicutes bacterium LVI A0078]|nr:DEAD/DEAH box helicase [Mollicutes bacterium LVI A0078]
MKVVIPNTSSVIKERGRQLTNYVFSYDYEFSEGIEAVDSYVVRVRTRYLGTKLYNISFFLNLAKDRSKIEFINLNCSCPHNVAMCKHMYAAMLSLSQNQQQINNLYIDFEIQEEEREIERQAREIVSGGGAQQIIEPALDKSQKKIVGNQYTEKLLNTAIISTMTIFEKEIYEFIPELKIDGSGMSLKLKVGIIGGKSYVVKDIYELPLLFQNKLTLPFSSSVEIDFVRTKFKNRQLVDYLILEINRGCALLNTVSAKGTTDWYGYNKAGKVQYDKKQLQLSPETLLSYLEVMDNQAIKFKYEQERIANYDVRTVNNKYELEIHGYDTYATLEGKEVLQFIQCQEKVIVIDPTWKKIEINDLGSITKAEAMCNLFNFPHLINQDSARMLDEAILKPLSTHLIYDYDFTKLYPDVQFIGFKTHLSLNKDKLTVAVSLKKKKYEEDIPNGVIENRLFHIINQFLELYDQPEFEQYSEVSVFEIKGTYNIINFVSNYLKPLEEICEVTTSNEQFKNFKIVDKMPVKITQTRSKGKSILKFESSEFSDQELLEVMKSINSFEHYLSLDNGKVVDLTSSEVKGVINTAKKLDLDITKAKSTAFEVQLASTFYYNKIFDSLNILVEKEDVIDELVNDYNSINNRFRKPKKLTADLRKYQKYGVNWMKFLEKYNFGGILADDMGLGKTLQAISHLSGIKSKLPTLIITPASLIYNWKYEFEKFTDNIDTLIIDGSVKERKKVIEGITNQICIISYDTFVRDCEQLLELKYNYVILDEAQYIKNANTKVSKAVKAVDSEHRLALTGTPIENNLNELWSLFDFVMPSFLGSSKEFKQKFITPIENGDSEIQNKLKQKITPFILRRLKGDVLTELPDKTEKVIHIKMQADQQKLYDSYAMELKKFLEKTSEDEIRTKQIEVLAMITKLRQIACNPILLNANYNGTNSKQEYLIEHLETLIENNHKTVLFSQFVSNFQYIEEELNKRGIKYCKITGQTPKQKRFEMVDSFNNDDTPIFLISLKAGGTGLNITGADTVIHYDPWWNTAVESQATDRVHRMGQTKNVFVYKLICEKTIEEQIVKLQEQKRKLSESLLDSENIKSSSLTKEEVLSLL